MSGYCEFTSNLSVVVAMLPTTRSCSMTVFSRRNDTVAERPEAECVALCLVSWRIDGSLINTDCGDLAGDHRYCPLCCLSMESV